MFDLMPQGPNEPTEITIRSVSNGWIVQIPKVKTFTDQFKNIGPMMKDIVKGMRESGEDEIETLIKNASKDLKIEQEKVNAPHYQKDTSLHIFKTFPEVLLFLSREIEEED